MQALELCESGRVALVDRPLPEIGPRDVLIRTTAATICTSDLVDIAENPFQGPIPRILGHEGAGVIVAAGEEASGTVVGQHVAVHPVIPCGRCDRCRRGLGHLCASMGHLGLNWGGTFAEYFCIRADRVAQIPSNMDSCAAALLEPCCVCLQAIKRARIGVGDKLLVVGDGPFGILVSRLAVSMGVEVVMVGRHEFRMRHARAALTIHEPTHSDPLRAIRTHVGTEGVDAAILCTASEQGVALSLSALRPRGRLVMFSALNQPARIDLFQVHVRELEIVGACNDQEDLDDVAVMTADPLLAIGELITHRFPIAGYREALRTAAEEKDQAIKVAFVFEGAV